MQGIEKTYCDVCIGAVIAAWRTLFETSATQILRAARYGKDDTLGLDATPEIIINDRIRAFDKHSILVTEELDRDAARRWPTDTDPIRQPLMFFSDPTDRSKQLRIFIERISQEDPVAQVGQLIGRDKGAQAWEEMFEPPASITGATTSITCVRKGTIVFAIILNYITQTITVAVDSGIYWLQLPGFNSTKLDQIDLSYIVRHGKPLTFPPSRETCRTPEDHKRFVTFLGKTGYRENFDDCMIFVDNPDHFLHHTEPGGPARVLYLSQFQRGHGPIGFIMANGEKISEWIHWLAFARFARNERGGPELRVFEISIDRPYIKDGILMSTSPAYSIFFQDESLVYLDISRLRHFAEPSHFRSMLVITPHDNERIIHIMRTHNYREIDLSI